MRLVTATLALGLSSSLLSQDAPQASVLVREDKFGAELVEITMLRLNYPKEALRAVGERIGAEVGTPSRGLFVYTAGYYGQDPRFQFLKCSFATTGLIDPGALRLQPIARAFAGASGPARVARFTITFVGERPGADTLQTFDSPSVQVRGSVLSEPPAIEYTVRLLARRPEAVAIPDRYIPDPPPKAKAVRSTPAWVEIVLIASASLAAGALVYSWAVLRSRSRAGRGT